MEPGTLVPAALAIVAAFLIGGIPFGVIVARLAGGPDPRTLGSGRTGGANVLRAVGPGWALVAGLADVAKGIVAVLLARWLGLGPWVEVLAACAAIIGHSRSPFLRFGGGRGVAVAFGTLLILGPVLAAVIVPVYLAVLLVTGYSSLGSLLAAAAAGLAFLAMELTSGGPPAYVFYAVAGPVLIWLFHLDNIGRLLAGTERKLDLRRLRGGSPPAEPAPVAPDRPGSAPPDDR
ncbi:MAG: glycerol-3-phosphate 1-O-acyltransferase PlsY [Chloroflexi bacterium]|nr:glycerol-3-phosphate 1-O-acyltransferase PlsY [Chloroflexota bacterium]